MNARKASSLISRIDDGRGLNVMSSAVMDALAEALLALASDEDLRAVVLSGAGDKSLQRRRRHQRDGGDRKPREAKALITRLHRCCDAIRNLPVPVIARIRGFCFGAGLEIAAACDVRLASETASFGMPEVKIGIPSVIEAALFPLLTGWGRAREILLLGETFSAARGAGLGIGRTCRAGGGPRPARSKLGSASS